MLTIRNYSKPPSKVVNTYRKLELQTEELLMCSCMRFQHRVNNVNKNPCFTRTCLIFIFFRLFQLRQRTMNLKGNVCVEGVMVL